MLRSLCQQANYFANSLYVRELLMQFGLTIQHSQTNNTVRLTA